MRLILPYDVTQSPQASFFKPPLTQRLALEQNLVGGFSFVGEVRTPIELAIVRTAWYVGGIVDSSPDSNKLKRIPGPIRNRKVFS